MSVNGLKWPHVVLFLTILGGGGYGIAKQTKGTDDVAGRIEGSHKDTIKHIDDKLKPLSDRLDKVEKWEEKAQALSTQIALLSQRLDLIYGKPRVSVDGSSVPAASEVALRPPSYAR